MLPEIHGLSHKDYAMLSELEIVSELTQCKEYIQKEFNHTATKFYTPWGAGADERGEHIKDSAAAVGLEMVTCENINKMTGRYGGSLDYLDGNEIFMHWWEGGARLKRIIEVAKHGSWDEAVRHNRRLFRE